MVTGSAALIGSAKARLTSISASGRMGSIGSGTRPRTNTLLVEL
jgi:hypothetical protein